MMKGDDKVFFSRKKDDLSVNDMVEIENWLAEECVPLIGKKTPEDQLSDRFNLKVEYTSPEELDRYVEAELRPSDDPNYNGLICVNTALMGTSFAYLHEIMHYIQDVGIGKRVMRTFTRKSRGHTETQHEQRINYATAAYIIPYDEVVPMICEYDKSRPKMDELKFVNHFTEKYGQSRDVVIRRIREVRKIQRQKAN